MDYRTVANWARSSLERFKAIALGSSEAAGWLPSAAISFDAVGDGVCDVFFSDNANDLIGPRNAA